MSRLAGLFFSSPHPQISQLSHQMMERLRTQPDWTFQSQTVPRGFIGYCGKSKNQIWANQNVVMALDGFIYNRSELGIAGSDAEILCHLYQKEGFEAALRKINGDFAAALYDLKEDMLWLGRDRLGVKPLYYVSHSQFFAFASRPLALLDLPGVGRKESREYAALFAASHYRSFDNHPEHSPFSGIAQLAAAQILRLSPEGVSKKIYWRLEEKPDFMESEKILAERYRDLLLDSVSLRLKSDGPPAFTLSGGMDSSSVLASAVRLTGQKQNAFSSIYSDKTFDEASEIKPMLGTAVQKWRPVPVDHPDVFRLVDEMVSLHDEPVVTATWLSHYLVCQAAKQEAFGALFGGLGGDELNAGEYEHYFFYFADLRRQGKEKELQENVALWAKYHDHPLYRKNFQVMEESLREMVDLKVPGRCRVLDRRLRRYFPVLNPEYFDLSHYTPPVPEGPFQSYLKNKTYQDLTRETVPCCLRAEDRQSMALGLDHFLPFLDYRLIEFMFRVPSELKIRQGITKHLLRKAMQGLLPEETRTRIKKTGWNAPAHLWFSTSSLEPLQDLVHSKRFRERGVYKVEEVERLIKEHIEITQNGRAEENHMMFLWQLVNLELWFRRYIDGAKS